MKHKLILNGILCTAIISILGTKVAFSVPKGRVIPPPQDLVPTTSLTIDSEEYSDIKITNVSEEASEKNFVIEKGIVYDAESHTISDVIKKWNERKIYDKKSNIYLETPVSNNGIYNPGKVNSNYLKECLDYLNFNRYLAYLPKVKLDGNLNTISQYGAVLLAKGGLSHTNPKPNDMSEEFYNIALNSTNSSNISYESASSSITTGIAECIDDTANGAGYGSIGHRISLFSSDLEYTGFGSCGSYSLQYVHKNTNTSYESDKIVYNHNPTPKYTCWPAKGAFPKNFIDTDTLWSVCLNYSEYDSNSTDNIAVKITRLSDNKVWNIPRTTTSKTNVTGFTASQNIIFHIAPEDLGEIGYFGKYKVEISNVKKINGDSENIVYTINFFDLNATGPGWALINGEWYYLDSEGNPKTGWIKDGGKWYFCWSSGKMASNTVVNGYYLDKRGVLNE